MGFGLEDLGDDLITELVASCQQREPSVVAVLVHGSYATGTAHPESDIDLNLVVSDPSIHYRTWFIDRSDGGPLHVSARCDLTMDAWEAEAETPEDWSLGLPVRLVYRWLWSNDDGVVASIGEQPEVLKPGGPPEIEDMVDAVIKMRRHCRNKDEVGVRLEAQAAARYAAPTVAGLNTPPAVGDPRSAIDGVISLPVAPPGWSTDFIVAAGLARASTEEVLEATVRLALGTLRLVREVDPAVDDQPEIEKYLRDGTLERLLR